MSMKFFIETLESIVKSFAEDNTEGSYYQAKQVVRQTFAMTRLPVTENQITQFVNRVWDKTHMEVA